MAINIEHQGQRVAFADSLIHSLQAQPFTGQTKAELELTIFKAYVEAGLIDLSLTDFAIARQMRISTRKVTALRYAYRIQSSSSLSAASDLLDCIVFIAVDESTNRVSVSVDDVFFREMIISELRVLGTAGDSSFNRSLLVADADKFLEVILKISGPSSDVLNKRVKSALRRRNVSNFAGGIKVFLREVTSGQAINLLSQFIN